MGQKVNPHGLRVGVIKNWSSRWFVKDEVFGDTLVSDYNIRKYLKNELKEAGISKIEIERDGHRVRVFLNVAKPGMVIGRGGEQIDKYKNALEKMVKMPVALNVVEIRQPDLDAQLVPVGIGGVQHLDTSVGSSFVRNRVAVRTVLEDVHFIAKSQIAVLVCHG